MKERFSFRARVSLVALLTMLGLVAMFMLPPLHQAQAYHQFADQRAVLGIPNLQNVVSNVAFLLVGLMGLDFVARKRRANERGGFVEASERLAYGVFFVGVTLTGFGSAHYHWKPCDSTLVWDRLPMTLAFMSMLAAPFTERINVRLGIWLLVPLVLSGILSVLYWQRTGNLWPYAGVQYYSPLLITVTIWLFPPRYSRTADFLWVVGIYALAKVTESLDQPILSLTKLISGHTLKHLITAMAVFWLLRMLSGRTPERQSQSGDCHKVHPLDPA